MRLNATNSPILRECKRVWNKLIYSRCLLLANSGKLSEIPVYLRSFYAEEYRELYQLHWESILEGRAVYVELHTLSGKIASDWTIENGLRHAQSIAWAHHPETVTIKERDIDNPFGQGRILAVVKAVGDDGPHK